MFFVSMRNIGIEIFLSLSHLYGAYLGITLRRRRSAQPNKTAHIFSLFPCWCFPLDSSCGMPSAQVEQAQDTHRCTHRRESQVETYAQVLFCHLHSCVFFPPWLYYPVQLHHLWWVIFFRGVGYLCNSLGGYVKTHWITISRKTRLSFFSAFSQL